MEPHISHNHAGVAPDRLDALCIQLSLHVVFALVHPSRIALLRLQNTPDINLNARVKASS